MKSSIASKLLSVFVSVTLVMGLNPSMVLALEPDDGGGGVAEPVDAEAAPDAGADSRKRRT